jgi:rubredoxin
LGLVLASQHSELNTMVTLVKKWQCMVCEFMYDEALGLPDEGIEPGTRWEDVPEDWCCPDCGVSKEDFEMVEVA